MTSLYRLIKSAALAPDTYPVSLETADTPKHQSAGPETGPRDQAVRIEQAYQAGYQAGVAAGRREAEESAQDRIKAFTCMVDDLASQRKRLVGESEEAVVRLSCEIARRVVGAVARIDENLVVEVVRNALSHLADKQKLVIRVNPEDRAVLESREKDWVASAGTGRVEITADARIKRGGCLVEGVSGSVEAQIDRQMEVMEGALLEAAK
jgi:flagellar biosynthesis/type III secretory pathway protein FliH